MVLLVPLIVAPFQQYIVVHLAQLVNSNCCSLCENISTHFSDTACHCHFVSCICIAISQCQQIPFLGSSYMHSKVDLFCGMLHVMWHVSVNIHELGRAHCDSPSIPGWLLVVVQISSHSGCGPQHHGAKGR